MGRTICFSTALRALLFFIAFLNLAYGQAATKFVKPSGLDTNNGNSWATAYKTPQKAFDSAVAGDTICFAAGTYRPAVSPAFLHSGDDRTKTFFIDKDLRIFGGFPATGNPTFADRNPTANPTIFSGDNVVNGINGSDLFHVLWIRLLPATSIIDGFTIRDGNASWFDQSEGGSGGGIYNESSIPGTTLVSNPTISNCTFINNRAYRGGALYNDAMGFGGASPTVINCTFLNNAAFIMGGAIYNEGRFGQAQASPTLINCLFSTNSAETGGAITNMGPSGYANPIITNCIFENNNGKYGGAIYNFGLGGNASPILTDCVFRNNTDGGRFGTGGAMVVDGRENGNSNPVIRNCTFTNNVAGSAGGIYVTTAHGGHSNSVVENCVFSGNISTGDNAGMWGNDAADGGTITATFTNCGMFNNSATNRGALFMSNSGVATVNLLNCTISGNTSHQGIVFGAPNGTVKNCIFWDNDLLVAGGNPNWVFSHTLLDMPSCPATISCGNGMLFGQDPLFVNAAAGDFHLLPGSPAFNAGTASGAPNTDFEGDLRPRYGLPDMGFDEMTLPCPNATIFFVNQTASGTGNGESWQDAFTELALALELANQCPNIQEIWVAEGTYLPAQPIGGTSSRHSTFNIQRDVKLFGGFAGNETAREQRNWALHPTILSGDLGILGEDTDNAFHVVRIDHRGPDMQLDGFTIADGNANGSGANGENIGGGLLNDGTGAGLSSNPTIANCTFSYNRSGRDGGAIANIGSGGTANPNIHHCTFLDNFAALEGGALYSIGTGGTANPAVSNCHFAGNSSTSVGGAVFINGISGNTAPVFESCTFQSNTATFHGGAIFAVGNHTGNLSPAFNNCLFYENATGGKGGAIAYDDGAAGTLQINHCAFGTNTAPGGGGVLGIIHWDNGQVPVTMTNCIAFANTSTFAQDNGAGELHLNHCLIEENSCPPGANCGAGMLFGQNPHFTNLAEGDFHLELNSPAINAGTTTTPSLLNDLDGNIRPFGSAPDMGCYELQQTVLSANAGPDQSICSNASAVMAAVAGDGVGNWTVASGPSTANTQFSDTGDANAIFTPAGGNGTYILRWTVSAPGITDAVDELVLTVKLAPSATITPTPSSVCEGGNLLLFVPNAGINIAYNWAGSGINNFNRNTVDAIPADSGLQTYTVTVTNADCTNTGTVAVTVHPQPSAAITGGGTYCGGTTVNLSVPDGASNYVWLRAFREDLRFPTAVGSGNAIQVTQSGHYQVIVTNSLGCTTTSTAVVTIADYVFNDSLAAGDTQQTGRLTRSGDVSTCDAPTNCPGILSAIGSRFYDAYAFVNPLNIPMCATIGLSTGCGTNIFSAAYNGIFTPNNLCSNYLGDIGVSPTTTNFYQVTIPPNGTITVVVHALNPEDTCSSYTLSVDMPRNPIVLTANPESVCQGTSLNLATPLLGGVSYNWAGSGILNNNTNATTAIPSATGPQVYAVTLSFPGGCTTTAEKSVTVKPAQSSAAITGGGTYCSGTTVNLSAPDGASNYAWGKAFSENAGFFGAVGSGNPLQVTQSGHYQVTITNSFGCTSTSTAVVIIANQVFNGSLATGDAQQTGRLTRSGTVTTCDAPTNCPGTLSTADGRFYDAYAFVNPINIPICATIGLSTGCGTNIFSAAYNGIFTPNNLCSNYLGDLGSSPSTTNFYQVTIPPNGTITVVVHALAPGGTCGSYTLSVDIPHSPIALIATPQSVCLGTTLNLSVPTGSSGSTYSWAGNGVVNSNTNGTTAVPTVAGRQTYTVTISTGSCSTTATKSVTVNALPTAIITPNPNPVCQNGTLSLSVPNAGTGAAYNWSGNGISNANANATTAIPSIPGAQTYAVTVTNVNNCSATTATTVTVNALPIATITPNPNPVCQNSTLNLSVPDAGAGAAYNWSGNGISNANANATTAIPSILGAQTYAVTVTNANNCSATAATTVAVNALPVASITPNTNPVCQNSTLSLSVPNAGAGAAYNWSGNGISNTNTNATTAIPSIPGAQTYAVTVTNANNCSATTATTVTVNALPAATITPNPNPVCQNSPLNLSVPNAGTGAVYNWSGNGINNANTNATTAIPSAPGAQTYAVTVTNANNCSATTATTVTVNALPAATITPNLNPVCQNSTLNLSVPNAGTGAAYNWSGNGISNTNTNATTAIPSIPGAQTYAVTVTNANNCSATTATTVTVNALPAATITPNPNPVCQNSTLSLSVPNAGAGAAYNWSGNGISNANASATSAIPSIPGAQTYSVTVTNANNCSATTATTVTVNALPAATITPNPNPVCQNSPLSLSVPNAGTGAAYNWFGNGISNANANATTAIPSIPGAQTYAVTVTNANNCSATTATTVTVNALPAATITPNPNPVCQNSILNLSVPNAGAGAAYNWSGNGISNTNTNANTATPSVSGPQVYSVTVTNANNCTNTGLVNVAVNPQPSATITATQSSACGPALVLLSVPSAGAGAAYNWSGNGVANNNTNATTASPNSGGNQGYQITVTNAQGCSKTGSTSIPINICIEGRIIWKQDNTSGVKDVTVTLSGDRVDNAVTSANGQYSFSANSGSSFMITPSKNLNKLNGVNAQDVFRIQQHLMGNLITDPYLQVAADVNANNTISALDVNIIQMALLGNPQALSQFLYAWRFVPTTHTMTNPPWGFPEKITIPNAGSGLSNQNFYGIKMGDVAAIYANPANAGGNPMVLHVQDQWLQEGQEISVDFTADQLADLTAFQLALRFDPSQLHLTDIQSLTTLPFSKDNFGVEEDGLIRVLWAGTDAVALRAPSPVFRLTFAALQSGNKLSDVLGLDNSILPAHVYNSANAESDLSLRFFEVTGTNDPTLSQDRLVLYQNHPNPFSDETSIGYYLPEAAQTVFTVYDVNGKLVYRQDLNGDKGHNQITLQAQTLPNTGLFYYRVETATDAATRKMVKVE